MKLGVIVIFLSFITKVAILQCSTLMKSESVLPYRSKRAIGKETPQYTQPWVSYLRTPLLGETKICHGFLVDPKLDGLDGITEGSSDIVLTAAHCVLGRQFGTIVYSGRNKIYFGKHYRSLRERGQVERRVVAAIKHPNYHKNDSHVHYDIAMLLLDSPVSYSSHIKPIVLSKYSLDEVNNCLISGLAGTGDRGLQTVSFHNFSVDGEAFSGESMSATSTPVNGDSGSVLVCFYGSMPVAQGVISGFSDHTNKWIFASIAHLLPWIIATHDRIRQHNFHNTDLAVYDTRKSANGWQSLVYARYLMKGMTTDPLELLDKKIHYKPEHQSVYSNISMLANIEIRRSVFSIKSIRGYSVAENAHECAVICYQRNRDGMCSYWSSGKRCYFSKSILDSNYDIYDPDWVKIAFDHGSYIGYHSDLSYKVESGRKTNVGMFWPRWNVSIKYGTQPFHCTGSISLIEKLAEIRAAASCLIKLGNDSLNFVASVTLMLQSRAKIETFDLPVLGSRTIGDIVYKFDILLNLPTDGIITEYPIVHSYEPATGSFLSEPHTMPWLVYFTISNKICMGVLLNESEFHELGRSDQTNFVLTTLDCALYSRKLNSQKRVIVAGSYFHQKWSSGQENVFFKDFHTDYSNNENFVMDEQSSTRYRLAIIELNTGFVFNQYIQPISLFDHNVEELAEYKLFMADWNTSDYLYKALSIIPVELIEKPTIKSSVSRVDTKRLYLKGRLSINFTGDNPLIACDQSTEKCQLVGFSHSSTENGVERHITAHPYKKLIEKAIGQYLVEVD